MHLTRHCERKKNWGAAIQSYKRKFLDCFVVTLLAMTMTVSTASANDKKLDEILEESTAKAEGTYAPDFCDFEITFPEKPHVSRRCPDGVNKCYQLHGYSYVYNFESSIDVTVHCAPSTLENYARYNDAVIEAALKGMRTRANIDNAEINVQEVEGGKIRQGSLLGTGTYGKQEQIYNAQIWVGKNSILTVEAKLIGQSNLDAEEVFSAILASIKPKD